MKSTNALAWYSAFYYTTDRVTSFVPFSTLPQSGIDLSFYSNVRQHDYFRCQTKNRCLNELHYSNNDGGPEEIIDLTNSENSDWIQAELTLRIFPKEPTPDLDPNVVLRGCCRSLQFVDHPSPLAGLARCFPFFTWECRKVVTTRRGGDDVDRFAEHGALSPALQPFMGATRLEWGEGTFTPGSPTRGDMISYPVTIHGSSALLFQHSSGFIKDGISLKLPVTNMVVRLERNRRPPLQGCWLVREILDVRYAFAGDMGNAHVGG